MTIFIAVAGISTSCSAPKVVEPPSTVRTNLFVIEELARRLGVAGKPGFGLTEREHIDHILVNHGTDFEGLKRDKWLDIQA